MLARTLRIQRDADFSRVYRKGKRSHTKHFVVTSVPNTLNHPRFACVVPKTISKKATVRNKIRRLVHEVLAAKLKEQPQLATLPLDVLISAKKGSEGVELVALSQELSPALKTLWSKR